jgi:hypothetical protein
MSKAVIDSLEVFTPSTLPSSVPIVPVFPFNIKYLANGNIDTVDWEEFRSEYGGFSVRAPKRDSGIGCSGHGCEPSRDGEPFGYDLVSGSWMEEGGYSIPGITMYAVKKKIGVTLDTWMDSCVYSGREYISSVQKTTMYGYPTLQFDIQEYNPYDQVVFDQTVYPSGQDSTGNVWASDSISYRYYIIDVGTHYIFISHTLRIDSKKFLNDWYATKPDTSVIIKSFNQVILADIYKAVLDSLQIFPPTKTGEPFSYPPIDQRTPNIIVTEPVSYTSDGDVDTSNWKEFMSDYGGFSVRAPDNGSATLCENCIPSFFRYALTPLGELSGTEMNIFSLKKKDTTLDTWIDNYILSHKETISAVTKTTVRNYPALQFDLHIPNQYVRVFMRDEINGKEEPRDIGGSPYVWYRYYIVDVGNRYLLVSYTKHIEITSFFASCIEHGQRCDTGLIPPTALDDIVLNDTYQAIMDSLQVSVPIKRSAP